VYFIYISCYLVHYAHTTCRVRGISSHIFKQGAAMTALDNNLMGTAVSLKRGSYKSREKTGNIIFTFPVIFTRMVILMVSRCFKHKNFAKCKQNLIGKPENKTPLRGLYVGRSCTLHILCTFQKQLEIPRLSALVPTVCLHVVSRSTSTDISLC
jgi:hypothetical protein